MMGYHRSLWNVHTHVPGDRIGQCSSWVLSWKLPKPSIFLFISCVFFVLPPDTPRTGDLTRLFASTCWVGFAWVFSGDSIRTRHERLHACCVLAAVVGVPHFQLLIVYYNSNHLRFLFVVF
ncbi:hypothetical protein EDB89DRAFT_1195482 [Lactarius sanguifluus]|nr:hypothetical protein EDB89DRAFT_1195482 [Lactarius sanguifluus]